MHPLLVKLSETKNIMIKFKKGDTVKITSGKDLGRTGQIEKVYARDALALVSGVNLYKKHVKAQATRDKKGGIFEIPRPLSLAKIALVCPNCKKETRVGFTVKENKKTRVCKKCKKTIN